MSADTVKNILAKFDDLASKREDVNVQFLVQAIKLHAELTNTRLGDQDGKEVWRCNAAYAEVHFKLERID
jgi:hypothetical protein